MVSSHEKTKTTTRAISLDPAAGTRHAQNRQAAMSSINRILVIPILF